MALLPHIYCTWVEFWKEISNIGTCWSCYHCFPNIGENDKGLKWKKKVAALDTTSLYKRIKHFSKFQLVRSNLSFHCVTIVLAHSEFLRKISIIIKEYILITKKLVYNLSNFSPFLFKYLPPAYYCLLYITLGKNIPIQFKKYSMFCMWIPNFYAYR